MQTIYDMNNNSNLLNIRVNEIIAENNKEKNLLISNLKDFENKYHQAIN